MPEIKNIAGERFGKLTAIMHCGFNRHKKSIWQCACDCGKHINAISGNLVSGGTKSCGCVGSAKHSLRLKKTNFRHGHAKGGVTSEYGSWAAMKARCKYESVINYDIYGGRGISVCARWNESFANFLADMGPKPSPNHSIDRIDGNGNYEPSNCRWATPLEQRHNRRPGVRP